MGNRAGIMFETNKEFGIYVHWNGGMDSVSALLEYCSLLNDNYLQAETFLIVTRNTFGVGEIIRLRSVYRSEGITLEDNGTYIVDSNWQITKRITDSYFTGEQNVYDHKELLSYINNHQSAKLDERYLFSKKTRVQDLSLGDKIYRFSPDNNICTYTVVGFTNIAGQKLPYIDRYSNLDSGIINPNNILWSKEYRTA